MALTLTISNIRAVGNRRYIRFSNGHEREFTSLAEFQDAISDIDIELLELIILKIIKVRRPDLTNLSGLIGKGVSVDFTSDTWGTVI